MRVVERSLTYAHQARDAGQHSYILRRAEAEIMLGRILEAMGDPNEEAEQAFRNAVTLLTPTNRIAARIRAHDFLGRHLLKKGQTKAGDAELDEKNRLSHLASASTSSAISTDNEQNEHNDGFKTD